MSANNPVTLLAHIGLDCPGAVQLCLPDRMDEALSRDDDRRELTDHEVARRLKAVREEPEVSWMGLEERWSLGGNQGKFALAGEDGRWFECRGAAPTTHILKNGVVGFRLQALNEYVCMRTAERCGVAVAHVDYRLFEDEPALIVERYDRVRDAAGKVVRLHQEDLCQALSVMPDSKYAEDGGPAARDVLRLLAQTDTASSTCCFSRSSSSTTRSSARLTRTQKTTRCFWAWAGTRGSLPCTTSPPASPTRT